MDMTYSQCDHSSLRSFNNNGGTLRTKRLNSHKVGKVTHSLCCSALCYNHLPQPNYASQWYKVMCDDVCEGGNHSLGQLGLWQRGRRPARVLRRRYVHASAQYGTAGMVWVRHKTKETQQRGIWGDKWSHGPGNLNVIDLEITPGLVTQK